jgi:hypothetical protein
MPKFSLFFLERIFLRISKMDFGFFPALQNERQNPQRILSHTLSPSNLEKRIDIRERLMDKWQS